MLIDVETGNNSFRVILVSISLFFLGFEFILSDYECPNLMNCLFWFSFAWILL